MNVPLASVLVARKLIESRSDVEQVSVAVAGQSASLTEEPSVEIGEPGIEGSEASEPPGPGGGEAEGEQDS